MPLTLPTIQLCLRNPNLALPLLLCGVFLIYLDFNVPGRVFPICFGTLAVAFALNALHQVGILPQPTTLAILVALLLPACLYLFKKPFLTWGSAILLTILLAGALLRLTPGVHPITAVLVATAYAFVTLKLAAIALLARHNKRIR